MFVPVLKSLQPEVAARYAPARSGHTRFYVMEWSREVDLCQLTLAEADELVKLPNGLDMLQPLKPDTSETIAALVTAPVAKPKRKRKTGAPGGK